MQFSNSQLKMQAGHETDGNGNLHLTSGQL